jgi:hypothetical protein
MEVSGQLHALAVVSRAPGTSCEGGQVGPTTSLNVMEKTKIPSPYRKANLNSYVGQSVA